MPVDPESNIEQQLQAYAQRRRDEAAAPFEMHPANRRLLQDEVARTYARPAADGASTRGFFTALWPRLALGGAVCAALAMALLIGLPEKKELPMQMAANREAPSATESTRPESAVAKPAVPKLVTSESASQDTGKITPARMLADAITEPPATTRQSERPAADDRKADSAGQQAGRAMLMKDEASAPRLTESKRQSATYGQATSSVKPEARPGRALDIRPSPTKLERQVAQSAAASPSSSPAEADRFGAAETMKRAPVEAGELRRSAPTSAGLSVDAAKQLKVAAGKLKQDLARNETVGPKQTSGAAAQPLPSFSGTSFQNVEEAKSKLAVGQRFQQLIAPERYRRNFNSPPFPAVLNAFQIEQAGQQVRIIDADGSLYLGELTELAPANQRGKAAKLPVLAEGADRSSGLARAPGEKSGELYLLPAGQTLYFRAEGTNRKLNQTVVIEGAFLNYSNASPAGTARRDLAPAPSAPGQQLQLDRLQVQGRAVIGGNSEIPINAVPTKP